MPRAKGKGKGSARSAGREARRKDPEHGEAAEEEDSAEEVAGSTKLVLFEFGQNDPKMDSGVRLCRFGLAKSLRPQAGFQGIVLSTMTQIPVSVEDREVIE
ncbi:18S rRNA aminocarboxypropyltransferase (20S rRNA accumulation protein 3) (ScTsr3), partial [Durusdinium trenchii]